MGVSGRVWNYVAPSTSRGSLLEIPLRLKRQGTGADLALPGTRPVALLGLAGKYPMRSLPMNGVPSRREVQIPWSCAHELRTRRGLGRRASHSR